MSRAAGDSSTLAATLISQALAARLRGDDLRAGVLLHQSVLREQLGAAAFDQARSRGRALQLEAAVAEALADD